jgi:hypothetical protein
MEIRTYDAEDVLELPSSHERELTLENLVEIQKQNTLEEDDEPEPEPGDRAVTVSELTEGHGFTDTGIWVFEGNIRMSSEGVMIMPACGF